MDDLSAVYELGEEVFTSELPNLYQIWSEAEVRTVLLVSSCTWSVGSVGVRLCVCARDGTIDHGQTNTTN